VLLLLAVAVRINISVYVVLVLVLVLVLAWLGAAAYGAAPILTDRSDWAKRAAETTQ